MLLCQVTGQGASAAPRGGGHDTEAVRERQSVEAPCSHGGLSRGEPCAHELLYRLERRIERLGPAAAGLRKIGPTATAPAHLRSDRAGELARLDARRLIRRHSHD